MKLRAQFVVDVTAADYLQAADHQRRLGEFLADLKSQYAEATLVIRERRKPKIVRPPRPEGDLAAAH